MSFGYDQLKKVTAVYVVLPVLTFLIGYLKPIFAVPGALVCLAVLWFVLRSRNTELAHDRKLTFSVPGILILAFVILLWGYLGGLNGFFYQSSDWKARNALYRDLITHTWPVVYEQKMTSLAYYIGHWLVPAMLSKPFYYLFGESVWWFAARMILWLWTSFALLLIALDLMVYTNADTRWKKVLCMVGFIGFSGMDAVGAWLTDQWREVTAPKVLHFEWWPDDDYQFSSMTTCLYWVFNQAVIPWLIVMNVLFERDPRNYLFWGMCCFLCGPFPLVGLAILMLVKGCVFLVRKFRARERREALRALFSPGNLILLVTVFPALAMFFLSNNAAAAGLISGMLAPVSGGTSALYALQDSIRIYLRRFLHIYVLDVGVYLYLLFKRRSRDPIFYAVALSLFILPFFKIGRTLDFAARTTIPGVFVLMVYVVQEGIYDLEHWRGFAPGDKVRGICLLTVFALGLMTPGMEIYRGIYNVCKKGTILLENDKVPTLDDQGVTLNFETTMFSDSAFFKYLAKRPHTDTVSAVCVSGFSDALGLEESAPEASFRLMQEQAELVLYNGYADPQQVQLQMVFNPVEVGSGPFTVTVTVADAAYVYDISAAAQVVTIPVTLVDTATKVYISASGTQTELPEDDEASALNYSFSGARLLDEAGGLLVGTPAQHPELESDAVLLAG